MQKTTIFLYYLIAFLFATINICHANSLGKKYIAGPVPAKLIRVVDGDTVLVDAFPWPTYTVRVYVRLRNIDTPELRSKCGQEKAAAIRAKSALINLLDQNELQLSHISGGKYFGRIIANVRTNDGLDVSAALIKRGLAVNYKKRRNYWTENLNCHTN